MEQVKIGNKIKNLIIRLASDLPIEGMDPIIPNEPYTVLHDIQASFVFEERIRTQKAQFSVLSYNNSKLGSVTLFNVPLTEKVMNLLFEREHLLSATMVEDTYADECGHIFLNRVSSKDFVYNLFLHDEDQKVIYIDKILASEIIADPAKPYLAIYEVPSEGWLFNKPKNIYFNLDMEVVGNEEDETQTYFIHINQCVIRPRHDIRFTKELSTTDLEITTVGDSWISRIGKEH